MLVESLVLVAALSVVNAQRPENVSICDYYTSNVLGENTAENQQTLMQLITHTFILGNYTTPNVGIKVAGVAAPGNFEGHEVNILNYFTGAYYSSNGYDGGNVGIAKNFLDDGGAEALLANKSSNTNSSNQFNLLNHVYQYFGEFYGCTEQGKPGFPSYKGVASMYEVHKFMFSDPWETGYFNEQIVLAGRSVGFSEADGDFTQKALDATFGFKCSPEAAVIPASAGPQLQAICISDACPLHPNATCSAYPDDGKAVFPEIANATIAGSVVKENTTSTDNSTATASGTSSGTAGPASSTGAASALELSPAMKVGSLVAILAGGFYASL